MKKICIGLVSLAMLILLVGCSQEQQVTKSKSDVSTSIKQLTESVDKKGKDIYKNEKYDFSIEYPTDWTIDEDKTLAGPGFRPKKLSMQDIQSGNLNQSSDCFFLITFAAKAQNNEIGCRNKLDEVMLGDNSFVKCNFTEKTTYMTLHPKTNNVFLFEYVNNPSCENILEGSLKTLVFN